MRLALIGCGFLGSLFIEEVAKLLYAHEETLELVCIDDDTIDERNPANHLYTSQDIGRPKVEAIEAQMAKYRFETLTFQRRLERESPLRAHLLGADLVADAVDNRPTRDLLWEMGRLDEVPVLHLGVSQLGTGAVEWTFGEYDTFSLSPLALAHLPPATVEAGGQLQKLRPCELVKFRGLGLNTALAAAKAVGICAGLDPTDAAPPVARGTLTTWASTNLSHSLVEVYRVP